jgi:hypothetical protein
MYVFSYILFSYLYIFMYTSNHNCCHMHAYIHLLSSTDGLEQHIDTWKRKGSTQATDTHIRSGGGGQHSTTAKSNPWNFQSGHSAKIEKTLVDKSIDVAVVPSVAKREVLSDGECRC